MLRKADKAGTWYEADPAALRKEAEECVARGAALYGEPELLPGTKPVAVVVPHAGLFFSGAAAATAYSLLRRAWEKVDAFVVFGACHRARLREPAIWTRGAWETPLGEIAVDESLAEKFLAAGIGSDNPAAHDGDNAVELQLPFIKHMFPGAKILPVAMSPFPDSAQIGARASALAREDGRTVIAIASTDLTHYGASFGLMPAGAGEPALAWVRENDERFLNTLIGGNPENIVPVAERDQSACGAGAAAAAAGWAQERGSANARVLARTNSHEIAPRGTANHIVGYGTVAFDA